MYKNVVAELIDEPDDPDIPVDPVHIDYDLVAYSKLKIDFEYIVQLLQGFVEALELPDTKEGFEEKIKKVREIVEEFTVDNHKLGSLLSSIIDDIEKNKEKYQGQDISIIVNDARMSAVDTEIRKYSGKWFLSFEDVKYEALNFRDGKLPNESKLKDSAD